MNWNRVLEFLKAYTYTPLLYLPWVVLVALAAIISTLPPIIHADIGFLCSMVLCWGVIAYLASVMLALVVLAIYHVLVRRDP